MELLAGVLNIVIFLLLATLVGITCGILLFLYKIFEKLIKYDSVLGFGESTNDFANDNITPENADGSVPLDSFTPNPRKPLKIKIVQADTPPDNTNNVKSEDKDEINPLE